LIQLLHATFRGKVLEVQREAFDLVLN
jgi:hypothetical protein